MDTAARTGRLAGASVRTGLLSVGGTAALRAVGISAVSEVSGVEVATVPRPKAPFRWLYAGDPRTVTTSEPVTRSNPPRPPQPATALRAGYRAALERLVEEVRAVGADGAVGVTLTADRIDGDTVVGGPVVGGSATRFQATGTAVQVPGAVRPAAPFTTTLGATACAAALAAGWAPAAVLVVVVGAVRFFDQASRAQLRLTGRVGELVPVSDVSLTCRRQAAQDLALAADGLGADGTLLAFERTELEVDPVDPWCSAVTTLVSDAVVRFAGRPTGRAGVPLTVLPVGRPGQSPSRSPSSSR